MLSRMLTRSQMALLCLGLFLALALCGAWQAFAWGRTQLDTGALVCADTLRLHIRAESDSIASQSAKLHVRDAVLAYLDTACPAQSKPEAIAWAAQHLFELQLTARHALAQLNIRTPVRVQLVNMYFDTRRYASGTLPAGRYDALRIDLGAGKGRNWWCVLYPSLCYTDAIHAVVPDSSRKTLSSLLAEDDYDALLSPLGRTKQPQQKPEVHVRFRLMDLFQKKG